MLSELERLVTDGEIQPAWAVYHKIKKHLSIRVRGVIRGAILTRMKELQGDTVSKSKRLAKEAFESLFKKEV